jgi:hypothetical protein
MESFMPTDTLLLQTERRITTVDGNAVISIEDRRHPEALLPDSMPEEFRALAVANIRGDKEQAEAAHELIASAEEIRNGEFRADAAARLAEVRATF